MLVVSHFTVPPEEADGFRSQAAAAVAAFAARPGYRAGRVGRATDDAAEWVVLTEWADVGSYRRALSAYDVRVHAAPLLGRARDAVSAFEVLWDDDIGARPSGLAREAAGGSPGSSAFP